MTGRDAPDFVLVGSPRHGVVRYARDIAAALRDSGVPVRISAAVDGEEAVRVAAGRDRVHVHVTDRVFGSSPEQAADCVEQLARVTDLSITLHDLPQPSDGTNFARRRHAYARFIDAAGHVVVNSQHEAQLISEYLWRSADAATVIPIGAHVDTDHEGGADVPEPPLLASAASTLPPLRVLVGGFVYPGKGHAEAISAAGELARRLEAMGSRPAETTVVAIGAPSAGHEADLDALHRHAATLGVEFRVTGFLDDDAYRRELSSFGIPLAAHQHVSASRSMIDWIERGRNALVVDSPYSREMTRLRPGTMTLYAPDRLPDLLEAAWRDPSRTRLPAGTSLAPTLDDTGRAYLSWWTGLHR